MIRIACVVVLALIIADAIVINHVFANDYHISITKAQQRTDKRKKEQSIDLRWSNTVSNLYNLFSLLFITYVK